MNKKKEIFEFVFLGFLILLIAPLSLVSAGNLQVTAEHPFLINNSWIPANQLHVGNILTNPDGKKVRIKNIGEVVPNETFPVYNLEAGKYYDFVVNGGDNLSVVVHNSNIDSLSYGQKKFLIESSRKNLPNYPINEYGVELDAKQLFGRKWNIPRPYKGWSSLEELKNLGSEDIKSYLELRNIANIGRAFNLETHLQNGKFILYGYPAEGKYIWALDSDGSMNIGLRLDPSIEPSPWQPSPFVYRSSGSSLDKILPHPALSGGKNVYGAGEITFREGIVTEVNAWSGHFVNTVGSIEFNVNTIESFKIYAEVNELKLDPDIKFITGSPSPVP